MAQGQENDVARFELVDEKDAPAVPKAMSKSAKESLEIINALKPGKVAKVTAGEGQSLRGLKSGLTRVATNNGKSVTTWDDGTHAYVKLT